MPLRVGESAPGQPIQRRHVDTAAVGGPGSETGVVVEDEHYVWCACGRFLRGERSPVWFGVADIELDGTLKVLVTRPHSRPPETRATPRRRHVHQGMSRKPLCEFGPTWCELTTSVLTSANACAKPLGTRATSTPSSADQSLTANSFADRRLTTIIAWVKNVGVAPLIDSKQGLRE